MFAFCAPGSAAAQDAAEEASAAHDDIARAQDGAISGEVAASTDAEPLADAALSEVLSFDAATSVVAKKAPARSVTASETDWSRSDAANGVTSYSVKQPLGIAWDSSFGTDFSVVTSAAPSPMTPPSGDGTAWANVDVPDVATVGVRAEPRPDYNKVGGSLQREMPVGRDYAVTLQSNVAVTELYASLGGTSTSPAANVYDTDNSVKFSIRSTGTAFSAGRVTSSIDPMAHTRLTAEQNIYGPLNVTGSLYDPGRATSSTSIGAGLKFDW
jgi:hypothetical protein